MCIEIFNVLTFYFSNKREKCYEEILEKVTKTLWYFGQISKITLDHTSIKLQWVSDNWLAWPDPQSSGTPSSSVCNFFFTGFWSCGDRLATFQLLPTLILQTIKTVSQCQLQTLEIAFIQFGKEILYLKLIVTHSFVFP